MNHHKLSNIPHAFNCDSVPAVRHHGSSRVVLHKRRATAATLCAHESPADSAFPQSGGNKTRQVQPGSEIPLLQQLHDQVEPSLQRRPSATAPLQTTGQLHCNAPNILQSAAGAAESSQVVDAVTLPILGVVHSDAVLSSSFRQAASWQQLMSLILQHSTTAEVAAVIAHQQDSQRCLVQQDSNAAQPNQFSLLRQQHPVQQHLQLQQWVLEMPAALMQLNGRHLAGLMRALVRLQPAAAPPHIARSKSAAGQQSQGAQVFLSLQQHDTAGHTREQDVFWSIVQLAFGECLQRLPSLTARELSTVLWAASKLTLPPSAHLLRQVLQQFTEPSILAASSPQDVSMSLYAVASLGVQVPEPQLEVLLSAVAARMHESPPQVLCNSVWAVATLQYRPHDRWLQHLEATCTHLLSSSYHHQQQQQQLQGHHRKFQQQTGQMGKQSNRNSSSFAPQGLYQLVWAMARLQWQPGVAFQQAFWRASLSQVQHMTPQGTSGVLWAVTSLQLQPPEQWVAAWLSRLQHQMQTGCCRAQDLGNALWAVVRLGLQPSQAWLDDAITASSAVLGVAGSQELSNMLWSFAKLEVRPGGQWMYSWQEAMRVRMHSYCAPALASGMYALAVMQFRPAKPWVQTLLMATQQQMPAFGAQELSNLLWSLAVLGLRPNTTWLAAFERQAWNEAGSFNAQELSVIFWSLAKLQRTPPAAWASKLLREGLEVAGGLQAQSLVLLLGSLTRWDLPAMHTAGHYRVLLPRYWAAAEQLLPQFDMRGLTALYAARVKLGVLPSRAWSNSFWQAVQQQLQLLVAATQTHVPEVAAAASCLMAISQNVPETCSRQPGLKAVWDVRQDAAVAAFKALPYNRLQPSVVSQLLWAAGKLTQQAPVPWSCLKLLLAAAVAVMPKCTIQGLVAVGSGLRSVVGAQSRSVRVLAQLQRRTARRQQQQPGSSAAPHRVRPQQWSTARQRGTRRYATSHDQRIAGRFNRCHRSLMEQQRRAGAQGCWKVQGAADSVDRQWTSHRRWRLAQPVWQTWFDCTTVQLLQANAAVLHRTTQLTLRLDLLQHSCTTASTAAAADLSSQLLSSAAVSAARPSSKYLQQRDLAQLRMRWQLGSHQQLNISCRDASLLLRVVASLRLRPPRPWLEAMLGPVLLQLLSQSAAEEFSWLVLDVVKVQESSADRSSIHLPEGFVRVVLRRAEALHASSGLNLHHVRRLNSTLKKLLHSGLMGEAEWAQWCRLMAGWNANQGLA